MAKNTYYIVFENNAEEKKKQKTTASNKSSTNEDDENSRIGDPEDMVKGLKRYASAGYAISLADRVISPQINTVSLRTGHEELQQRMQFTYGFIKQGASVVQNAVAAGTLFGGAGAVIGAVVGIADSLINISIKQGEINTKRQVENMTIALNNIRMGTRQDRGGRSE